MTQSKLGLAGVVAAVALGVMGNAVPFEREASRSGSNLVIAGDETTPAGAATKGNAEESAKMGKDEGAHTGPNLGATPENDTSKIDQPARRNIPSNSSDD